ncbi:pilus assembly protein PilN, partial [Vibrio vulnificus]
MVAFSGWRIAMQHKINLLPWREHKREEHKRR